MDKPNVFLCHVSEDKELAQRIASEFIKNGIDTFFDKWEIKAGDSIVQKINEGLDNCTHFVVLLTQASVNKPWVKTEMDAGLVKRIEGECKFIPLRSGLSVKDIPSLLRPLLSPEIKNFDEDIRTLIGEIFEVSRKPEKGKIPDFAKRPITNSDLSTIATKIVEKLVIGSQYGLSLDPQYEVSLLQQQMGITLKELEDSIYELEELGLVYLSKCANSPIGIHRIETRELLFVKYDSMFMPWNPENDAKEIAAFLVNNNDVFTAASLKEQFQWEIRRLNPALSYLIHNDIIENDPPGYTDFVTGLIIVNHRTRRFVRENQ